LSNPALTPRETQVIHWLALGKTIKDVATILNISPKTSETHRRAIYQKLTIENRAELTLAAITLGLVGNDAQGGATERLSANFTLALAGNRCGVVDCPCPEHQTLRRAA
jgi:DNA-binding CsgD family transcriptional regulator